MHAVMMLRWITTVDSNGVDETFIELFFDVCYGPLRQEMKQAL